MCWIFGWYMLIGCWHGCSGQRNACNVCPVGRDFVILTTTFVPSCRLHVAVDTDISHAQCKYFQQRGPLTSADVADTKILAMFAQLAQRLPFSSKVCPVVLVCSVWCWCVVSVGPLVSGNTGPWVLGSRYGPVHPPQNTSDCKVFASAQKTL